MGNLCIDFKKLGLKERIAYGECTFRLMQRGFDRSLWFGD